MMARHYKHIFGPVLSRRLGRSLGIDIMPFKTCTYDCVYCEQGRTTNHTVCRKEYVPVKDVLMELQEFLSSQPVPDYVTLSGAGEPTLHARLGELVKGIKEISKAPLAVITNGSLLWDPEVQEALHGADVVMPSLDAGNSRLFDVIDRPASGITFERMVYGLIAFRAAFHNAIWLEVLLIDKITSGESEVREIAAWARRIQPDRVQLNTVVRPPSEEFALPIPRKQLEKLAGLFEPCAEIIADYSGAMRQTEDMPGAARMLELLARRPCSMPEIAGSLGLRLVEAAKLAQQLIE